MFARFKHHSKFTQLSRSTLWNWCEWHGFVIICKSRKREENKNKGLRKANVWFSHPKCLRFEWDWKDCKTLQSVVTKFLSVFQSQQWTINFSPWESRLFNGSEACRIELSWRCHRCQQQSSRLRRTCIA